MRRSFILALWVALFTGGCDISSKQWAIHNTSSGTRPLIDGFFFLVHRENPGMAFSLMHDWPAPVRIALLSTTALLGIIGGLWLAARNRLTLLSTVAIGLVVGGAAGNLIDRLGDGTVTDFLHVHRGWFDWPAFNVADIAICVGATILAVFGMNSSAEDAPPRPSPLTS